jgi:phosphohistidine swiveling domain-containing protein
MPGDAERGLPIVDFKDGDIIVASMIHPAWLPYFRRAAGLVCEVGGWLSHSAILAREYELPMIVGTQGLAAIMDGNRLRLHPDGTVEIVTKTTQQHIPAAAAE